MTKGTHFAPILSVFRFCSVAMLVARSEIKICFAAVTGQISLIKTFDL